MAEEIQENPKSKRLNHYKRTFDEYSQKVENGLVRLDKSIADSNKNLEVCLRKIDEKFTTITEDFSSLESQLDEKVNNYLESFNTAFTTLKNNFTSLNTQLSTATTNSKKASLEIENLKTSIEEIKKEIEDYRIELFEGDENNHSIKKDIEISQSTADRIFHKVIDLEKRLFGTPEKLSKIDDDDEVKELNQDEIKIINGIKYKIDVAETEGINQRILKFEELICKKEAELENRFNERIKDYNTSFNDLKKQIESFLPNAMSAGLSAAYEQTRMHHKEAEAKWANHFKLAMLGIVFLGICFLVAIYFFPPEDTFDIFKNILKIAPFEGPLIWYAWIASKRIKEEARLHEEHLHKWSVAYSFEGLVTQAKNIDNEEKETQAQRLFNEFVEAYSTNPSNVINVSGANSPFEKIIEDLKNALKETVLNATNSDKK